MAQASIEALGFEAVNPIEVVRDFKAPWGIAMKKCIKALVDCDAVFVLPCANNSRGAKIERDLAFDLKIPVYQQLDMLTRFFK